MVAIYKCRLCGKEFETFTTGPYSSEMILYSFIMNKPSMQVDHFSNNNKIQGVQVYPQVIHYCEDGSRGLADLLGFKMEEINKGEEK